MSLICPLQARGARDPSPITTLVRVWVAPPLGPKLQRLAHWSSPVHVSALLSRETRAQRITSLVSDDHLVGWGVLAREGVEKFVPSLKSGGRGCLGEGRLGLPGQV